MSKKEVYFNEFNIPTKDSTYLPYSSGLLRAYAETFPIIKQNYEFKRFLFVRDSIENLLAQYHDPNIAAFSCSVWNFQVSLTLAKAVKSKFPNCLIVFGGPQVPLNSTEFFIKYPFIDLAIYGEGERVFSEILIQNVINRAALPFKTSWHKDKAAEELDIFPSPYATGLFDECMDYHRGMEFKAIVETNRACPFSCAFCFWGQGSINKKLAYHSIDYTRQEAEWIATHDIKYVFCADANFGMFKRDVEIAQIYADYKKKYARPEKFRVCYGKNVVESIFETASILSKAELAKTVTLAIQSNDPETLKNIKRANIKMDSFINLQKRYTEAGIPTYTEIILGLPGETRETFLEGLEKIIGSILNNQVFIYHCQILPNTAMAAPEYLEKHGIKTVRIPLAEVHGNVRLTHLVEEFEEIVVGTNTMPTEEWVECAVIAWITQLCHGLKIGFDIVEWLVSKYPLTRMEIYTALAHSENTEINEFWNIARGVTEARIRCQTDPSFGSIYWEPEEITFVRIAYNKDRFYRDFHNTVKKLLISKKFNYNKEIDEVFEMQKRAIPNTEEFHNPEEFATQVVLYGRKSNKMTQKDLINKIPDLLDRTETPLVLPFD